LVCCSCCGFNIFLLVVCCAGDVFFSFLQTCSSSVVVVVADYLHTNKHPKEIDKKVIIKRQLKTLKKHSLNVKYNNILTNMYTI
jgi:protein-arginine kinase activator protein McsA